MDRKIAYYAVVCILAVLIVANTASWFVWQYAPLTRIDIDL